MKKEYRNEEEKQQDRNRLIALTSPSYNDTWVFNGTDLPEFVCRYILGIHYEIRTNCNYISPLESMISEGFSLFIATQVLRSIACNIPKNDEEYVSPQPHNRFIAFKEIGSFHTLLLKSHSLLSVELAIIFSAPAGVSYYHLLCI